MTRTIVRVCSEIPQYQTSQCIIAVGCVYHQDVSFRGNRAEKPHMWGGAVAVLSDASADFRRCFFQQNVADRGGAVYVKGETGGRRAVATLESCELTANRADEGGGTYAYVGLIYPSPPVAYERAVCMELVCW